MATNPEATNQARRHSLDRLSAQAARFLLRMRLSSELRRACSVALAGSFVLPLLMWLLHWVRVLQGPMNLWQLGALAVLGPLLYVLARLACVYYEHRFGRYRQYRQYLLGRHTGLALYDAQLGSQERLVTADEFLSSGLSVPDEFATDASRGFMQASVEDAERYLGPALSTRLSSLPLPSWHIRAWSWLGVAAAMTLALLSVRGLDRSGLDTLQGRVALPTTTRRLDSAPSEDAHRPAARQAVRPRAETQRNPASVTAQSPQTPSKPQQSGNEQSAAGQANSGAASAAQSSNTSSSTAGESSSQSNASKPKPQVDQRREEPDSDNAANRRNKRPEQGSQLAMEATSGQGKSSASSATAGRLDTPEQTDQAGAGSKQEDAQEESEDEDEQEEENSAGANKPGTRNQKPPVDRNAPTGFASNDGTPMSGNGRGGAGGLKKTRGVPSMILGIPAPDRVPGMLGPGRSKVTQENASPVAQSHDQAEAQQRLERSGAMGHLQHPQLLPWMQALIRNYFLQPDK